MGKQKHDIGHQKRNLTNRPEAPVSTDELAKDLVARGLASRRITESIPGRPRK